MEAALYDPEAGFYARGARLGAGRPLRDGADGAPGVRRGGARGGGGLPGGPRRAGGLPRRRGRARATARWRARSPATADELVLVERAAGMRALQEAALGGRRGALGRVAPPSSRRRRVSSSPTSCWTRCRSTSWSRRTRSWSARRRPPGGGSARRRRPSCWRCSRRAASRRGPAPATPCGRASTTLLAELAAPLERGRLLLVDYGGEGAEVHDGRRAPVRTYVAGQPGGDPLQAPGRQDLTADVDFGHVRRVGGGPRAAGAALVAPGRLAGGARRRAPAAGRAQRRRLAAGRPARPPPAVQGAAAGAGVGYFGIRRSPARPHGEPVRFRQPSRSAFERDGP